MQFLRSFVIAMFLCPQFTLASPQKYATEAEVNLGHGSKFRISAGWSFDPKQFKLVSPEGDVIVHLLEIPYSGKPEDVAASAWKVINPAFDFKVQEMISPPPQNGWEQVHTIVYEAPTQRNKILAAEIRVFKGRAFVLLLDASREGLTKRQAQLAIVADSWKPADLKTEDWGQTKPRPFAQTQTIEMDRFIAKAMKDFDIPGTSVAIIQAGKVVYRKSFGVKKFGGKEAVTPNTLFMIGSTTKPLTTLMLAKMIEKGKLTWDTPIVKVLPQFSLADKTMAGQFLVKHAACACTGMPRADMGFIFGSTAVTIDDNLRMLHQMRPTTALGETFQYSNHLVVVAGLLGAQAYNQGHDFFSKYENSMTDLVFKPLGMTSTRVKPKPGDAENLASPHASGFDGKTAALPQTIDDFVYSAAPAGSVWSNIDDLSKYVLMELNEGKATDGTSLFSKESILRRRVPGVKVDDSTHYGLGLFIEKRNGIQIVHHDGNTFGFTHGLFFLPKQGLGMIVQINAGGANGFKKAVQQKLFEIVLNAVPKADEIVDFSRKSVAEAMTATRERISTKPSDLKWVEGFVGAYNHKDLGRIEVLKSKDGFVLQTSRWQSLLGQETSKDSKSLLALTSAPWAGAFGLRAEKGTTKKLVVEDGELKYEFVELDRKGP
jgi:CubicO group peptidase (beta-lactamase class C family)